MNSDTDQQRFKWLARLDEKSRTHVILFGRQVSFILIFCTPALFVDHHRPALFLHMMRAMLVFSTLLVGVAGIALRPSVPAKGLCIWHHVAAMLALAVICSIIIRLMPEASQFGR